MIGCSGLREIIGSPLKQEKLCYQGVSIYFYSSLPHKSCLTEGQMLKIKQTQIELKECKEVSQ